MRPKYLLLQFISLCLLNITRNQALLTRSFLLVLFLGCVNSVYAQWNTTGSLCGTFNNQTQTVDYNLCVKLGGRVFPSSGLPDDEDPPVLCEVCKDEIEFGKIITGSSQLSIGLLPNIGIAYLQAIKSLNQTYGDINLNPYGGNVGIGFTGNPSAKLQIIGIGNTAKDLIINGRILTGDGNNNGGVWFGIDDKTFVGRTGNNVGFVNNGAWRFLVDPNGNVGIGTSTTLPAARLQIQGIGNMTKDLLINGRIQTGDANNNGGVWYGSDDKIFAGRTGGSFAVMNNGAWRFLVDQNGKVGIGIGIPQSKFHISGDGNGTKDLQVNGRMQTGDGNNNGGVWCGIDDKTFMGRAYNSIGFYNNGSWRFLVDVAGNVNIGYPETSILSDKLSVNGSISSSGMIKANTLAIGSTCVPAGYALAVNGKIRVKGIKMDQTTWCDYVFERDYKLKSLEEVEAYINKNHHLEEVPTAAVVNEEGIDIAEINAVLLKKVEELTLYQIQSAKEIKQLKAAVEKLKRR